MYSFEKLEVWQKTRALVRDIYKVTALFPREDRFGLTQHVRKSAISVLSNIAEATSRFGDVDFKRFIEIAIGSLYETVSQLFVAFDNNYIENKREFLDLYKKTEIIARMLSGLSASRGQKKV